MWEDEGDNEDDADVACDSVALTVLKPSYTNMNSTGDIDGGGGDDGMAMRYHDAAYAYIIPLLVIVGLVGHAANLIVLARPPFRRTVYTYLRWMSVADVLMLVAWLPTTAKIGWDMPIKSIHLYRYYKHLGFSLINIFLETSSLLVVAVTVERWSCVWRPLRATSTTSNRLVARVVVLVSFLLPTLAELPTILGKHVMVSSGRNTSEPSDKKFVTIKDAYKSSYYYEVVFNWSKVAVLLLAPIVIVILLNIVILYKYQKGNLERMRSFQEVKADKPSGNNILTRILRSLTQPQHRPSSSSSESSRYVQSQQHRCRRQSKPSSFMAKQHRKRADDQQLSLLLLCIVIFFIIAMVPQATFQILHYTIYRHHIDSLFQYFTATVNMLTTLNAALNFYLYCLAGKHFRKHFLATFGCRKFSEAGGAGRGGVGDGVSNGHTLTHVYKPLGGGGSHGSLTGGGVTPPTGGTTTTTTTNNISNNNNNRV